MTTRDIRQFERNYIKNRIDELKMEYGLDVGCGKKRIFGIGVDDSVDSDAEIICDMKDVTEYCAHNQQFIICCHSLEHTDFVIDSLIAFNNCLVEGGKLFIAVPDGNWVDSGDLGDSDMKHRQVFTMMTLTKLVEYCGFKVDVCKLIEKNALFLEATKL